MWKPVHFLSIFLLCSSSCAKLEEEFVSGSSQPADGEVSRELVISNEQLTVRFSTETARFSVEDTRSGRTWEARPLPRPLDVRGARLKAGELEFDLVDADLALTVQGRLALDRKSPEMLLTLSAEGAMGGKLKYPAGFQTAKADRLILPLNEGISYPVEDVAVEPMNFILFGGHGLCMAWYGVTDGVSGWMSIVETPDDALVDMDRREGRLELQPEWYAQKELFGYDRIIRYVFFDEGGYVAMAKRYREYAQETGLFKTLLDKREERPNVDILVGAANIWFDRGGPEEAIEVVQEMQAAGMHHILLSHWHAAEAVPELNKMGVLTSVYDIYQDAMNPKYFPRLERINQRWPTEAWSNDDIIVNADGRHFTSWRVEAIDGERIACGVVCDKQVLHYARERIPAELEKTPYLARLMDTTTAARWRECYHPDHPMNRTQCKGYRMDLLRYQSETLGLVCGGEAGHDAGVPYVDFFEGMLSLWPYRVPDSGQRPPKIYHEVPDNVAKFQTGHAYRLPLWGLVYHDCVVRHWYWGDFNNKLPALWDRRDLWNVLYGTPPLFRFGPREWEADKDRFVQSYQTTFPVARATGYSELLSHEWLTDDHAVQQTRFANGVIVTVNFGDEPYEKSSGRIVPPLDYFVEGLPESVESL